MTVLWPGGVCLWDWVLCDRHSTTDTHSSRTVLLMDGQDAKLYSQLKRQSLTSNDQVTPPLLLTLRVVDWGELTSDAIVIENFSWSQFGSQGRLLGENGENVLPDGYPTGVIKENP